MLRVRRLVRNLDFRTQKTTTESCISENGEAFQVEKIPAADFSFTLERKKLTYLTRASDLPGQSQHCQGLRPNFPCTVEIFEFYEADAAGIVTVTGGTIAKALEGEEIILQLSGVAHQEIR